MEIRDLADPQETADALFGALCLGAMHRHGYLEPGELTVDLEKVIDDLARLREQTVIPDTTTAPEWCAGLLDPAGSTQREQEMLEMIELMIGEWSIRRPQDERAVIFETIYLDMRMPSRFRYSAASN